MPSTVHIVLKWADLWRRYSSSNFLSLFRVRLVIFSEPLNPLCFLSPLSLISFFMLLPAANTGKRRTALYSSGFISPAFVDPLASLYPTASWIVDPPSGDFHREENKRATSFVILRRRFYWRCGLNRYFSALASRLPRLAFLSRI